MRPVILVSLDYRRPQDGKTGLGIGSIAAALKASEVSFRILDHQVNSVAFSLEQVLLELRHAITEAGPGCLVGFGTYVWNDGFVQSLIEGIEDTCASVVLGGPQISYLGRGEPEQKYPGVEYFVRGQGEKAMVALAQGCLPGDCGIHVAGTPDLARKADHDLATLPSPYLLGTVKPQASIRWETQRGCPFKCTFCQHREPGNRLVHQCFDVPRLEREIALFAAHGVERISVLDPIIHTNPAHAISVMSKVKAADLSAKLALQCRFETCSTDFLNSLEGLDVTLEFGLQTVIEAEYKAIKRLNKMAIVSKKIRELQERQIDFEVSLIYGLPNQTLESFRASVDWCKQKGIPRVRAWPLMLLRGTPLYDQKAHFGYIESTGQSIPIAIASNSFSEQDHAEMTAIAKRLEADV